MLAINKLFSDDLNTDFRQDVRTSFLEKLTTFAKG